MADNQVKKATLADAQVTIEAMRTATRQAREFARQAGVALREQAEAQNWCDDYDTLISTAFSDEVRETVFWEIFHVHAQRTRMEEKRFRLTLEFEFTADSYEYQVAATSDCSAEGTYMVPSDFEVHDLDDLEDDRVEHISGTDLVAWRADAEDITVEVGVEESSFDEA